MLVIHSSDANLQPSGARPRPDNEASLDAQACVPVEKCRTPYSLLTIRGVCTLYYDRYVSGEWTAHGLIEVLLVSVSRTREV